MTVLATRAALIDAGYLDAGYLDAGLIRRGETMSSMSGSIRCSRTRAPCEETRAVSSASDAADIVAGAAIRPETHAWARGVLLKSPTKPVILWPCGVLERFLRHSQRCADAALEWLLPSFSCRRVADVRCGMRVLPLRALRLWVAST